MSKPHKGNNSSWRIKAVNDIAVTTKLEVESVLSSEANRKNLQEKTKCSWCTCPGHEAQRCNTSWKQIEDTKEKNKHQITN